MFTTDPSGTGEVLDFFLLAALVVAGFVILLLVAEGFDADLVRAAFGSLHARLRWLL